MIPARNVRMAPRISQVIATAYSTGYFLLRNFSPTQNQPIQSEKIWLIFDSAAGESFLFSTDVFLDFSFNMAWGRVAELFGFPAVATDAADEEDRWISAVLLPDKEALV